MVEIGLIIALVIVAIIIIIVVIVVVYVSRDKSEADAPSASTSQTTSQTAEQPASAGYGLGRGTGCEREDCMYGSFSMKGAGCRALGGNMDGTPGDTEWTNCRLDVDPVAQYGLHPTSECPEGGTCPYTAVRVGAEDCAALGGYMNKSGSLCHLNVSARPKYRIYRRDRCPAGQPCRPIRIDARSAAHCTSIGGVPDDPSATDWTLCGLSVGPA